MIFVDTNVLMYAVGRPHPLREEAQAFFADQLAGQVRLASSAEVLQELLHAYLPVGRIETLDSALTLAGSLLHAVWPVELEDVHYGRRLVERHGELGARDVLHLACCKRRGVREIKTFDRALAAVARKVL